MSPIVEPKPISSEEAEAIVGGVSADITYPSSNNWNQWYDNLRFKATIDGPNSNSIGLWVGGFASPFNTNVGMEFVQMPAPNQIGTYNSRHKWPYGQGQKFDLVLKVWDTSTSAWNFFYGPWSDDERLDQYLNWNVKLHRAWVHNTDSLFYETHLFSQQNDQALDRVSPSTPNKNSNTIDGVYGQCGALASNGINKTQWRHMRTDTIFAGISCNQLAPIMGPKGSSCCDTIGSNLNSCGDLKNCIELMFDETDYAVNDAHVFIVANLGCNFGGVHLDVDGRSFVAVTDEMAMVQSDYTMALAHEFGHAFGEGHTSRNCGSSNPNNNNLMCADGGRVLTSGQCSGIRDDSNYIDHN